MRVRACHKCKLYIPILPNNPQNLRDEALFKLEHLNHTTVICDYWEVKDKYQSVYKKVCCDFIQF